MRLIDADELLGKTINNPLHAPYITKKDVIDMPSALNNQINLCDSCTYTYPECSSKKGDVIFGNGIGNDNICACNKYQPTIQLKRAEGEWILYDKRFPWRTWYKCSSCGNYLDFSGVNGGRGEVKFCPNCGANMKGERT